MALSAKSFDLKSNSTAAVLMMVNGAFMYIHQKSVETKLCSVKPIVHAS